MNVFVFGSNHRGFHGAGAAGYAMLGIIGADWKRDRVPGTQLALDSVPDGTKGYLAVKGRARGFQEGREGASYAIETIYRPGERRSVSIETIKDQVKELYQFAKQHPEMTFQLTRIATGNAGYTEEEMRLMYNSIEIPRPNNIVPI